MQTRRFKKIMVAVGDFDRVAQKMLAKAAAIAQRFDAQLEVLHVASSVIDTFNIPVLLAKQQRPAELARLQKQQLEKLVRPLAASGVKIDCISILDYPLADGIVRQVLKRKPDLLVMHSQRGTALARVLLSNTDWELIRNCPCPLWIVKTPKLAASLAVLAAIDPFHIHAKPAALDNEILNTAGQVVGTGAGRLGICHAYSVPEKVVSAMSEVVVVPATAAEARSYRRNVTDAVRRAGKQYVIAVKDQLLVEGDTPSSLAAAAKRWKADLLVMGALSRRGLKRLFIGNTAERALDAVNCDVLVVKPKSFKSPVPRNSPMRKM